MRKAPRSASAARTGHYLLFLCVRSVPWVFCVYVFLFSNSPDRPALVVKADDECPRGKSLIPLLAPRHPDSEPLYARLPTNSVGECGVERGVSKMFLRSKWRWRLTRNMKVHQQYKLILLWTKVVCFCPQSGRKWLHWLMKRLVPTHRHARNHCLFFHLSTSGIGGRFTIDTLKADVSSFYLSTFCTPYLSTAPWPPILPVLNWIMERMFEGNIAEKHGRIRLVWPDVARSCAL